MSKSKKRPEEVTDTPDMTENANDSTAGAAASGAPEDLAEPAPATEADAADAVVDEGEEVPLEVRVEQAEARAADFLESLQRERASFQNYKRRIEAERTEQRHVATASVLLKMLPVLDDFHRAMQAVPAEERNQWFEGVQLIQRKFERILEEQGVKEIEALGQPFDPRYHEAIGVDNESDAEPDTVTDVLQRGYMQGDRVLRPAMVRVSG